MYKPRYQLRFCSMVDMVNTYQHRGYGVRTDDVDWRSRTRSEAIVEIVVFVGVLILSVLAVAV